MYSDCIVFSLPSVFSSSVHHASSRCTMRVELGGYNMVMDIGVCFSQCQIFFSTTQTFSLVI